MNAILMDQRYIMVQMSKVIQDKTFIKEKSGMSTEPTIRERLKT